MELLAPAGSWEALKAAVQNGADAVYIGGKEFNARHSATNFDRDELSRAIDYAHLRDVKVYVTVNVLIADREINRALEFLHFIQNVGADGVIVQDRGLSWLAGRVLPELPLHASTQMTVHNAASAKDLLEEGFKRIVLAREMSLSDIAAVRREIAAEIEVFVHGALCFCYSGQCLFSSMIGGRSGNRGRCAQPCRMQYSLVNRSGKPVPDLPRIGNYLLSPRDLNLSGYLPELLRAGVDSLKIEGRMKRSEYVATVVRVYRELIDLALSGEEYRVSPEQKSHLWQVFNREFTCGYFNGNPGQELMSFNRPNNRGVFLGRVSKVDGRNGMAEVRLENSVQVGDGLEVWVTEGGREGTQVHNIIRQEKEVKSASTGELVWINVPRKARVGDRIFKTSDFVLIERARKSFASARESRKIPLKFFVRARVGEPLLIRVEDKDGLSGEGQSAITGQLASTTPLTPEILRRQLDRLGNTPFALGDLKIDLHKYVIFPLKDINEARRRALSDLEKNKLKFMNNAAVPEKLFRHRLYALEMPGVKEGEPSGEELQLSVIVSDYASVMAAVEAGADIVYFGGELYRSKPAPEREDYLRGAELCGLHGVDFILSTPRIVAQKEFKEIVSFLKEASRWPIRGVLLGNPGLLDPFRKFSRLPVFSDFAFNVFNKYTILSLERKGFFQIALSPELTFEQIAELSGVCKARLEVLAHGDVGLMVSEHCLVGSLIGGLLPGSSCRMPCLKEGYSLKDRRGYVFPLETDQFCRLHIFNSREICLIEDIRALSRAGVRVLRIDARRHGADYVDAVLRSYRRAINLFKNGRDTRDELLAIKEYLLSRSPAGFTKGHYYRGVI